MVLEARKAIFTKRIVYIASLCFLVLLAGGIIYYYWEIYINAELEKSENKQNILLKYKEIDWKVRQTYLYQQKLKILQDAIAQNSDKTLQRMLQTQVEKIQKELSAIGMECLYQASNLASKENFKDALFILDTFLDRYSYSPSISQIQEYKASLLKRISQKIDCELYKVALLEIYGDTNEARIRFNRVKNIVSSDKQEEIQKRYLEILEKAKQLKK